MAMLEMMEVMDTHLADFVALMKTTSRASMSSRKVSARRLCSSVMSLKRVLRSLRAWLMPLQWRATRSLCMTNSAGGVERWEVTVQWEGHPITTFLG